MLVEIGEHDPDFETIFDVWAELDSDESFLENGGIRDDCSCDDDLQLITEVLDELV
jgi:hypothetical protein